MIKNNGSLKRGVVYGGFSKLCSRCGSTMDEGNYFWICYKCSSIFDKNDWRIKIIKIIDYILYWKWYKHR